MSLLHRNLVAAAFQEMLKKIEPIAAETADAVLTIVAPKVAPLATAVIDTAEAIYGQVTGHHVDAGVAAAGAPPVAAATPNTATVAPAASAPASPPALVNVAANPNQAALAAVDALAMQLSQLATQLAAIRSNLAP